MSQSRYSPPDENRFNLPILKKGKACVNCRRRKMRCDGVQPICGSCMRTDKADDCEYTTGSEPSTSQRLEEQIRGLQTRLHNLQMPSQPPPTLTLQQPYSRSEQVDRPPSPEFNEPPQHIKQRLADTFLAHASQYGFFLHPGRFRNSVFFPAPVGHELRPSPSLLSVMYLLGIHLSQDPDTKRHEKAYLDLAIQQISHDTSSTATKPKHRLHVIQAEIILSYYFFANKRDMEGGYHASSAYSLGVASGIQKMRTRNPPGSTLPPVTDDIEEGERVNACWSIFTLDNAWAGILGYNPNFTSPMVGGMLLTTPMPREIEEYETGRYRCERREGFTLNSFLTGTESRGESLTSKTVLAKATFLFERARAFARTSVVDLSSKQRNEFMDSFNRFRNLAMAFKTSLPPFETWLRNPNIDMIRTAYIGVTLLGAALIELHGCAATQGDEKARQLRVISAQEIFNNSINLVSASWNLGFLNPIIGFAWRAAFNVLFQEFNTRSMTQSSWSGRHPGQEDPLHRQLRKGVSSFAVYSNCCTYINCEVKEMMSLLHGTPM